MPGRPESPTGPAPARHSSPVAVVPSWSASARSNPSVLVPVALATEKSDQWASAVRSLAASTSPAPRSSRSDASVIERRALPFTKKLSRSPRIWTVIVVPDATVTRPRLAMSAASPLTTRVMFQVWNAGTACSHQQFPGLRHRKAIPAPVTTELGSTGPPGRRAVRNPLAT